ncbi:DNA translocase FtsK [Erysipelothrix sp. HDW6C]|uniref:DNA translocase FtsK n=1 Tax=Erysipelothrix sp. HDW6C TaxID=2714930 RepID=UPI00140DABB4|nr:DNA translocase FtsK [Erysipelothrix sp. HDW6C]QIK69997.1 DNA translocase FtsK [Erysipelothrix sp. HDW6C]
MTSKKKKKTKASIQKQKELIRFISAIVVIGLSLVANFRYGLVGEILDNTMRVIIGEYTLPYYILIIAIAGLLLIKPESFKKSGKFWSGIALIFMAMILVLSLSFDVNLVGMNVISSFFSDIPKIFASVDFPARGGLMGAILYGGLSYLLDRGGVIIFIVVFAMVGLALLITPARMLESASKGSEKTSSFFEKRKEARRMRKEEKERQAFDALIEADFAESSEPVKAGFLSLDDAERIEIPKIQKKSSLFMSIDEGQPTQNHIETSDEVSVDVMTPEIVDEITLPSQTETQLRELGDKDNRPSSYEKYRIPAVSNLDSSRGSTISAANKRSAEERGERLISVLKQFGIESSLMDTHIGPAVTKFEIKPDSNVKISKISSIQDNLMMELAVKTLRIEAPIPGKSAVGIEIPNVEMIPVKMRDVINQSPTFTDPDNIQVALGKDLMGKPITVALNKMPHLLVAGATGSGKSVCMNSIITSILLTKTPDDLKLLLIDPKKVEFTPYTNIPHLIGPVISDPMQASMALKVIVDEMETRYDLFSKGGVRNIGSYNEQIKLHPEEGRQRMPWIVVIIDELADLMAVAGKDVETSIQRITQLARAAGIHLIVATQRPSVDVVTGVIKANIPSRIAFAVSSAIDSRTILDATGADKLLGYGDMLYIPMGEPNPIRVQGVYVSDDEVRTIAEKASVQAKPRFDDAFIRLDGVEGNNGMLSSNEDPLYDEAFDFVVMEQRASTSLLQRKFKVGYNRAANLIDALEQNGVIGPANGSKPRDVYKKQDIEIID